MNIWLKITKPFKNFRREEKKRSKEVYEENEDSEAMKSNNTLDHLLTEKDPMKIRFRRQQTENFLAVNIYEDGSHIYTTSARNSRNNANQI